MADENTENVINMADHGLIDYSDIRAEEMLEKAKSWELKNVVVIGFNAEGDFVWGGSTTDAFLINALADFLKQSVLNVILQE